jgi:GNAT superfamily N-acetyltransferase
MTTDPVIRRATPDDAETCHEILWESVTEFGARHGTPLSGTAAEWWASSQRLQRFLADHAAEWWVAEDPDSDGLIGFARSIERGGLFELTEFFVRPSSQSRGVGRALIERAFPAGRGDIRSIIATTDVRALSRYYAADTMARFPILTLGGVPARAAPAPGLDVHLVDAGSGADIGRLRSLEAALLEYPRDDEELRWLLEAREGFLYLRDEEAVGFGFLGRDGAGPIGALSITDLSAILLHIEDRAAKLGLDRLELQVPAPNKDATRHLLSRGFRLDPWINLLMSNRPFGQFDRLISFGPPVFL